MSGQRIEGKYCQGFVEPVGIINSKDRVEVNWSAIGSVSVPEAEAFAVDLLRVCAETRLAAQKAGIEVTK